MKKQTRSNLLCLLTAMIWGGGFVAQKTGGVLGAFTYNGPRCLLGGMALLPLIVVLRLRENNQRPMITGGIICGVLLFLASSFQQIGINGTTTSKAGFITSLYAIIVPFFAFFMGRKIGRRIWLSVGLSLVGLYLLNNNGTAMIFAKGDLLVFVSSFLFALQIIAIDHYASFLQPIILSCLQFLIAGILGTLCMFLFETPHLSSMIAFLPTYLYGGILSTGAGYTLQIIAQKDGNATQCALILCLESVFSALGGTLFLHERLLPVNYLGCAFIFAGVVLSSLTPSDNER